MEVIFTAFISTFNWGDKSTFFVGVFTTKAMAVEACKAAMIAHSDRCGNAAPMDESDWDVEIFESEMNVSMNVIL